MGKKRRHSRDRGEDLWRKFRRLEKKIEDYDHSRRRYRRRSQSRSLSRSRSVSSVRYTRRSENRSKSRSKSYSRSSSQHHSESDSSEVIHQDVLQHTNENTVADNKTMNLEPEIIEVIGERLAPERIPAPPLHEDLQIRMEEIVRKGLPSDEWKLLINKFPPPSNCLFMDPPGLNIQIKAALQDAVCNRDLRIQEKQRQIGACMGGISLAMSIALNMKSEEKVNLISTLSGVARLLAHVQHGETAIRRSLILKNINSSLRDTLNATPSDEWIFGKNLDETMRIAKSLESTTKSLRQKNLGSKNQQGPLRRNQQRYQSKSGTSSGHKFSEKSKNHPFRKQTNVERNSFKGSQFKDRKRY